MDNDIENGILSVGVGVETNGRNLYVFGFINQPLALKTILELEKIDSTDGDIRIVLCSEGGHETAGYAIYDAIRMCRNRVIIHGYGQVCSIAVAILQAGDVRRLSQNTILLLHSGSIEMGDEVEQNVLIEIAQQIEKDSRKYFQIIADSSGQSVDTVNGWCSMETYFTAEEALSYGLCDELVKPLKNNKAKKRKAKNK